MQIDPAPMWNMLLDDLSRGLARGGHGAAVSQRLVRGAGRNDATARRARRRRSPFDTVALSGGCFQNRILFESVAAELRAAGFAVLTHADVPANDGGLALGQAAIGAARLLETARPQERPKKGRDHVSRHSRLHRQNRRCGEYARDRRYLRRPPADQYRLHRRRRSPGGKLASATGCWSMSALP